MSRQRVLLAIGMAIIISLIFSPMAIYGESGVIAACGHRFLTAPGICDIDRYPMARIDYWVLLTYWIGIVAAGYFLTLGSKPEVDLDDIESRIKSLESEIREMNSALEEGDISLGEYTDQLTSALKKLIENQSILMTALTPRACNRSKML